MTMTVSVGICLPANLARPPSIAEYRGVSRMFVPARTCSKIRTDRHQALGALGWKAKEGKKDSSQEKERHKS